MKNLIRKILLEEEKDDGFDWVDDIYNSPDQVLDNTQFRYEWESYIPEIQKKVVFEMNPENWNLRAGISIQDITKTGHGSFGDEPHRDYEETELDGLRQYNEYSPNNINSVGYEESGEYNLVDVYEVSNSIEDYSKKTENLTREYKQKIQSLTREYVSAMKEVIQNSDFKEKYGPRIKAVTRRRDGSVIGDKEWNEMGYTGEGRNYPGRRELRKQFHGGGYRKNRRKI